MLILALLLAQFGGVRSVNPAYTPVAVVASSGCSTTPPATGTTTQTGVVADGDATSRSFDLLVPAGYVNTTKFPVVFIFHEAGGTSAGAEAWGITTASGAAANAIFVVPQGIAYQTFGVGWDGAATTTAAKNAYGSTARDVKWFDSLLAWVQSHYCTDTNRVFAAGFSWGCDQVTDLSCARGNVIRAVSVASCSDEFISKPGASSDYRDFLNFSSGSCTTTSPAVRFTWDSSGGDSGYSAPDFVTTSKLFRALNKCSSASSPTGVCSEYAQCASRVVDCPIVGLGHARPATWGQDTWNFFASF